MQIDVTVRGAEGYVCDVALRATPESRVSELMAALHDAGLASSDVLYVDDVVAHADDTVCGIGLRPGAVLGLGAPVIHPRASALTLDVVGGPSAGDRAAVVGGSFTIGRSAACQLALTRDPDVSRVHAVVDIGPSGVSVNDAGSTNGTWVDGTRTAASVALAPGQIVRVGDSFLRLREPDEQPAVVREVDGVRRVNRAPRREERAPLGELSLPAPPPASQVQRVQLLAAALPALAGVAFAWTLHAPQFLFFALLSPVMLLATALGDRLHWRRTRRRSDASYRARLAEAQAAILAALEAETAARRRAHPDAAAVLDTALLPGARLWERRRGDDDVLRVRLGLGDVASTLTVRDGAQLTGAGICRASPLVIGLADGPLGVAGPSRAVRGAGRWLLGQLAVAHSPADLEIVLLVTKDDGEWHWSRWLPHLRHVATTAAEWADTIVDLTTVAAHRRTTTPGHGAQWAGPWTVVLVDYTVQRHAMPSLAALLAAAPVGIAVVWLASCIAALPTACATVADVCGESGTRVRLRGASVECVLDQVSVRWADRLSRALAPLTDADAEGGGLPPMCALSTALNLDLRDVEAVAQRWAHTDGGASSPIGLAADGPCVIDLVRDGPHALIGGTTGSGKSELLQTLIAGLAANYPPDELTFLLVDYKGGAAFADCARLPHAVGLVTDLDAALTRRALRSLEAELVRRERLFAAARAADLDSYRALAAAPRIARLVIVVDEFAALAEELPDFVPGLVGIAQRGRSLGLHLVLATQRPGSVVSPEIRANTSLRIGLRVTDAADSVELVGTAEAALIDRRTPGRAVLRVAGGSTPFQCAHSGAPVDDGADDEVRAELLGPWRSAPPTRRGDAARHELAELVDLVRRTVERTGRQPAPSPWREPLPDDFSADAMASEQPWTAPVGRVDVPAEQRQEDLSVDLAAGPALLLVGGGRSGRSSALVTIAVQAARQLPPSSLHVQVIDPSGGLAALRGLPHCGTYAGPDNAGVAGRLIDRLLVDLDARRQRLASWGHASAAEARSSGRPLPQTLLLVDTWELFAAAADERDAGRATDALLSLARTGAANGITVVAAGDRGSLSPRVATAFGERLVLSMSDRADFAMAGLAVRDLPDRLPPGRGVRCSDVAEVQFGFVGRHPTRAEQQRVVQELRDQWPAAGDGGLPRVRIRPLPLKVALADVKNPHDAVVLGVGGDDAQPIHVPATGAMTLLVAGPPRSGRSTLLCTVLSQLAGRADQSIVVAAPIRSPLAVQARNAGLPVHGPDDHMPDRTDSIAARSTVVLLDDLDRYEGGRFAEELLEHLRDRPDDVAVIATSRTEDVATSYRGLTAMLRRNRCGVLLCPGPVDGDVLGVHLPRHREPMPPGRGVLVGDPGWGGACASAPMLPIQVAQP